MFYRVYWFLFFGQELSKTHTWAFVFSTVIISVKSQTLICRQRCSSKWCMLFAEVSKSHSSGRTTCISTLGFVFCKCFSSCEYAMQATIIGLPTKPAALMIFVCNTCLSFRGCYSIFWLILIFLSWTRAGHFVPSAVLVQLYHRREAMSTMLSSQFGKEKQNPPLPPPSLSLSLSLSPHPLRSICIYWNQKRTL